MSLFQLFQPIDIHKGLEEFEKTKDALLLDVRTVNEYKEGHIPGSYNLPLEDISSIEQVETKKERPIFVYCFSGRRSAKASESLKKMGYQKVKNIGGINSYKGRVSF